MIAFIIWTAVAVGIFLYNHLSGDPYLGVRFTEGLFGQPLSGGWLAAAVAAYCLARFFVRRARRRQGPGG